MTKVTTTTKETSAVNDNASLEVSKSGVAVVGISSAFIGCWAVACLVSGMISSGGPVSLVSNFVTAVIG